jgi:hypothetical protein
MTYSFPGRILRVPLRRPLLSLAILAGLLFSFLVNAGAAALVIGAFRPDLPREAVGVVRTLMKEDEGRLRWSPPPPPPAPSLDALRRVAWQEYGSL